MKGARFSFVQFGILVERYLDLCLADLGNVLLLFLQAPIITFCIVMVWRDVAEATNTTLFVMGLSAVWFGAINASRELVKERDIYCRERAIGLEVGSYVTAKFFVLGALGCLQCLVLVVGVDAWVPLLGGLVPHFLVLYAASLAGTGVGLAISSLSSTPDRAVAVVPIVLLPQILFSEVVLPADYVGKVALWLQDCTITQWAYSAQQEILVAEPRWGLVFRSVWVLLAMAAGLVALATACMATRK